MEQDDVGDGARVQRDHERQLENANRTVAYSKRWAQVLKETTADGEFGAFMELPRWHSRAQSICIAQIKWAPIGIGYLSPMDDGQVVHSIMLAALLGEMAWTDLDPQANVSTPAADNRGFGLYLVCHSCVITRLRCDLQLLRLATSAGGI